MQGTFPHVPLNPHGDLSQHQISPFPRGGNGGWEVREVVHLPKVTQLKTEFNEVQIPESKLSAPHMLYAKSPGRVPEAWA